MAFQIKPREDTYFPKKKATKNKGYLAWLHELPCCVTGRYGVEAAHLSYANPMFAHYGRGRGTKSSDRWALPLSPEEHRKQHSMNEEEYWHQFPWSPHILALTIWGVYSCDGDLATEIATSVIMSRVARIEECRFK